MTFFSISDSFKEGGAGIRDRDFAIRGGREARDHFSKEPNRERSKKDQEQQPLDREARSKSDLRPRPDDAKIKDPKDRQVFINVALCNTT